MAEIKEDSRYVGAFFNSYTNTRMKLHRHCVPLDDDPEKIAKVYGYQLEEVTRIFVSLEKERRAAVAALREKYGQALDTALTGRDAVFVFIGDQFTSEYLSYYNLLRVLFAPYEGIRVAIAGNTGDTSNQAIQYVYSLAVSQSPTITSIFLGTNDSYCSRDPFQKTVASVEEYQANLDSLVKVMRHNGSKVILNTLPPVEEDTAREAYRHMNWACTNQLLDRYSEAVRTLARENRCVLNDLALRFKSFPGRINLESDGVLLTGEAQRYVAECFLDVLLPML